ncbi:MAG TPA: ATP-grasp domain-containing protein [Kofleriaceae bacterium]|nr:ATP-grasp domain-containing protein [Kofleriaceae bacterium]
MPRRVLLLAATTAYQLEDLGGAARKLGLEPLFGTDRCHVLAEEWPAGALALDFRDPARAAAQAIAAMGGEPVAGVVATDEKTALIAGLVAARLGLRAAPIEAARAAADKRRFRERMRAAGLPHPDFAVVAAGSDPRPAARALGYPVVVKPLHLSASRGVMRADGDEELVERAARLERLLADPAVAAIAAEPEAARMFLVERFVPGDEVAFEGLVAGGVLRALALFDKPDPLDGPTFAETIYVTPSQLTAARQEEVTAAVAAAARAIGLDEGPVHAELRLPPGAPPVVLELAARSIGGLCGRVLRFGAGIALEEVVIAHACGLDPGALDRSGAPAGGVMMLPVEEAGVLVEVRGVEAARAVPGVRDVVITARAGDHVVPLPEGHAYAGFLFSDGDTPAQVVGALRAAAAALSFEVRRLL